MPDYFNSVILVTRYSDLQQPAKFHRQAIGRRSDVNHHVGQARRRNYDPDSETPYKLQH